MYVRSRSLLDYLDLGVAKGLLNLYTYKKRCKHLLFRKLNSTVPVINK